ncbi:MAG: hypothetical protein ACLUDG_01400 [Butyricicoccus sp.]|nr:hypothetical protein [Butyricicoccus pullicaecorum]
MEPIPLSGGQLMATNPEDYTLIASNPELIAGALATDPKMLARLRETCPEVPVGLMVRCPVLTEDMERPMVETYMRQCRKAFPPLLQHHADFYYLYGAADFYTLRAAVLAMTDLSGSALMAELPVDADARMEDGTDCLAAVAVLQRIGVSTIILTACESQDLPAALHEIAPHARVSLGVRCPAVWLLRDMELPNVELFVPMPTERAHRLADLVRVRAGIGADTVIPRELDDVVLAPDGRDAHFIDWTTSISDEISCDHLLGERLVELEDEAPAAFKLLLEEEEDVLVLEENLYMITRPVCLCAESPELLEKALRVYAGLALYDGTWEQEGRILKYFSEKYGLICM